MSAFIAGLEPFRVPAFRRFIVASSLARACIWIYLTVLAWTVLETTGSATVAGLLLVVMTIPVPFATLAAGTLTDRLGPRTVVSVAYGVQALAVLATALLAISGLISVPLVLLLALVLGTADGFVIIPEQVLAGRTVKPRAMASAITLAMLALGVGRIVGAPIGGLTTAFVGPSAGLLIAGVGFGVAALVILMIPRMDGIGGGARVSVADLRLGMTWVSKTRAAMVVVALGAVAAFLVWPYLGLLPMVARDVLAGGSQELGLIAAIGGLGAIVAALTAGVAARVLGAGVVLVASVLSAAVLIAAFGLASWLPASLVISMLLSLCLTTFTAMGSLTLQAMAPLEMRGRVLAVNVAIIFALMPIGTLLAAMAVDVWGITNVMLVMGVTGTVLCGLIMLTAIRQRLLDVLREAVRASERAARAEPAVVLEPVPPAAEAIVVVEPYADADQQLH